MLFQVTISPVLTATCFGRNWLNSFAATVWLAARAGAASVKQATATQTHRNERILTPPSLLLESGRGKPASRHSGQRLAAEMAATSSAIAGAVVDSADVAAWAPTGRAPACPAPSRCPPSRTATRGAATAGALRRRRRDTRSPARRPGLRRRASCTRVPASCGRRALHKDGTRAAARSSSRHRARSETRRARPWPCRVGLSPCFPRADPTI